MSYTLEKIGKVMPTIPPMPKSGGQPKEKDIGTYLAVKIVVDDTDLDAALKKANRLVELLSEASSVIGLLGERLHEQSESVNHDR